MKLTVRKLTKESLIEKYQAIICLLNKQKTVKQIQLELKVKQNTFSDWLRKRIRLQPIIILVHREEIKKILV